MTRLEEDLIVLNATPIRMRVSMLCGEGMPLDKAKEKALAEAKAGLQGVIPHIRTAAVAAVNAMTYADLHPEDRRRSHWHVYDISVDAGLIKNTRFNRFCWRYFGRLW